MNLSRRAFLKRTGPLIAGAAIGPQIIPAGVLAFDGRPGANDRIVTGHIGLGMRGRDLLRRFKHVGAVCDVDQRRLKEAQSKQSGPVAGFQDYRRLLDRKDIDAVVIATPDHWHALMAIQACQAGKHVYLETPFCRSLEEGLRMKQVVAETKRVVQVGGQARSNPLGFAACQVIRSGMLGDIQRVECWHPPDPRVESSPSSAPPAGLDWNLWLGPLNERPFDEKLFAGGWRNVPDLGGGELCGHGFHVFGLMTWFLDLDPRRLRKVIFTRLPADAARPEYSAGCEVRFELVDPTLDIVWAQPGVKQGKTDYGAKYLGTKDTAVVEGGSPGVGASRNVVPYISKEIVSSIERSRDHIDNWTNAIRSGRPPIFPVKDGFRANVFTRLACLAEKMGGEIKLEQGVSEERVEPALQKFDHIAYRSPWKLKSA
ncbi:hypothetical protein GC207_05095 [bacterium]|nr:hypothetical protein [bacterium]